MDDDLLTAALAYAERGWWLLPVRGKLPALDLCPSWSRDSTRDPHVIASWLAGGQRLGVAVDLARSGLVVIDGDHLDRLDVPGEHLVTAWRYRGDRTRCSWLFAQNGHQIPQASHPWGEVKSAGGYVVLPPSPHASGVAYEWLARPGDAPPKFPEVLEPLVAPRTAQEAPGTPWTGGLVSEEGRAWVAALLARQAACVAAVPRDGGRNRALNAAAMALGHYVGHAIDKAAVVAALERACHDNGLVADDGIRSVRATLASGLRAGMTQPQAPPVLTPFDVSDEKREPDASDAVAEFWDARPALSTIRAFALARRASPWAVLGCVLARIVASVPPFVQLPPLTGGHASLNLFIALVGPSGKGKGVASAVAADMLTITGLHSADTLTLGSGEGLAHAFMRWDAKAKALERIRTCVLLDAPEIDTMTALGARQGATLLPELRKAWGGEQLGFGYADPTRRLPVPAHTYRLSLLLGVQPQRARPLVEAADGGTPQRFAWFSVLDPDAPALRPPQPPGLTWRPPRWPLADASGRVVMAVAQCVVDDVDAARLASLRGEDADNPLAGHAPLAKLKLAAALALLDSRAEITEPDWELAGTVMAVSDRTRDKVVAALAADDRGRNRARADSEATRAAVVADHLDERATARALAAVLRCLDAHAGRHELGCRRRCLKDACNPSFRPSIEAAIERGVAAGQIVAEPAKQGGLHYRRGATP